MRSFAALFASLLWLTSAALADPAGDYRVEGVNPGGGSSYKGTVSVAKSGETYRVVWVIQGQRYIGTGIGDKNFIAVSYRSGNETGLALYGEEGSNWVGIWAYQGGRQVGAERWVRQ
jgi:hypothetical protein